MDTKFSQSLAAITQAQAADPRQISCDGKAAPYEVVYAERMRHWTRILAPQGSEELQLAVSAQHIRRWELPRSSYAMDRKGYLQWREALKKFHAQILSDLMQQHGYAAAQIQKATHLILRKNMAADAEGQTLEDAACLTFLELDFADLLAKTPSAKMISIVQKTWQKMSAAARALALARHYSATETKILRAALA